jgi:hypothetical protein
MATGDVPEIMTLENNASEPELKLGVAADEVQDPARATTAGGIP